MLKAIYKLLDCLVNSLRFFRENIVSATIDDGQIRPFYPSS